MFQYQSREHRQVQEIKNTDNLNFEYENYNSTFKKRLAEEYKATKNCGSINDNVGCVINEDDRSFTYYKTLNGKTLDRNYFDDGGFITIDGATFFIEQGSQAANVTGYLVSVDLNGYKKQPNRMGYDFFMFQITKEGKVLAMGAENTYWKESREELCSNTSSSSMNGFTCAYYAVTDKDYFKNLH